MADETRLDTGPAATRRDDAALPAATRVESGASATRVDSGERSVPQPRRSLFNLPGALEARYRIVEPLPTAGAEAELLIVQALQDGQNRVAKLYRPGIQPKTEVLRRIAAIAPEHVVHLLEHGQSDGLWYELLEYCRFGSLRRFLRGRPIQARYVERIFTEVFKAVAHLHESGIIHRDLKPENVLIRATDPLDLVLTDFGIASVAEASQHFTSASRTVKYGAPEAASGVISPKADYWSLGMMLIEALTGRHPFDGLSEPVINQRLATRPIDVSAVADPRWRVLCRGLLHRNPEERWDAGFVERWLEGDTTLAVALDDAPARDPGMMTPYTIEGDACTTAQELGVALARHWATGVKDLARGFVASWVSEQLRDMNLSRFLLDLADDTRLAPDVRLLKLILRLAPGIPAIWRGEPLQNQNLVAMAAKAAAGDDAARKWIDELSAHDVLAAYAAAGDTRLAELERAWKANRAEVQAHLDRLLATDAQTRLEAGREDDRPPDMDALMFGQARLRPSFALHPDIVQLLLGQDHAAVLRAQVLAMSAEVSVECPWFNVLGPVETLDAAQLLAMKAAFPQAQAWANEVRERRLRDEQRDIGRAQQLLYRLDQLLGEMRMLQDSDFGGSQTTSRDTLTELISAFRELDADAAGVTANNETARYLRNTLTRARFAVNNIERELRTMRSWVLRGSAAGGGPFVLIFFIEFIFQAPWLFAIGALIALGAFGWFGWQRWSANGKLREMLRRLPRAVLSVQTGAELETARVA